MKNKMGDVRNHLVAMMEALGEHEADANTIARAKATAEVAGRYIDAIKVEIDARRLLADSGMDLPPALEAHDEKPALRAIGGRKA